MKPARAWLMPTLDGQILTETKDNMQGYQPLTRLELREKYGGIPQDKPTLNINPDDVPVELHPLIPLAEKWGLDEENWRPRDALEQVPEGELEHLVNKVRQVFDSWEDKDPLGDWFYAMVVQQDQYTDAIEAFTKFHRNFEYAKMLLNPD